MKKYGSIIKLPRYVIQNDNGDNLVEFYFQRINIIPHPYNLFDFDKNTVKAEHCYISKYASMLHLEQKISRVLNVYLYFKKKNKEFTVDKMNILMRKDGKKGGMEPFYKINDNLENRSKKIKELKLQDEEDDLWVDLINDC